MSFINKIKSWYERVDKWLDKKNKELTPEEWMYVMNQDYYFPITYPCSFIEETDSDENILRALYGTKRNGKPYLKVEDRVIITNKLPWQKEELEKGQEWLIARFLGRTRAAVRARRNRLREKQ